ncbi:hypothetical protein PHLCEN_2v10056 [Hermanssonia centrifuga]|uniref:Uncharacterized protein n=1 Tax=Hermanssonia centrifuga TaxID=98765 RepID=A0A2R6NNS1_9APHY|nr:hypothetical protein PHLCEN_2v10056 [Hermanssonia centrifuga]
MRGEFEGVTCELPRVSTYDAIDLADRIPPRSGNIFLIMGDIQDDVSSMRTTTSRAGLGSNASLHTQGFWGRFVKTPKGKESELPPPMALTRQRLVTLSFETMETIRMELEGLARDWIKPPPDISVFLRIPIEYASLQASLTGEDTYQIAIMGVHATKVEIVADAPPPPDDPPPPPVLEMPATFNLELAPGQLVALDTTISSDELDMARMEDGTTVDGLFWGKLSIVHQGDDHSMEFSGTRILNEDVSPDLLVDSRVMTKLAVASKPPTARCHLSVLAPTSQYCDITLSFSSYWKLGNAWPNPESLGDNKVKYFLRVHPGGAVEYFETEITATSLYYEAM